MSVITYNVYPVYKTLKVKISCLLVMQDHEYGKFAQAISLRVQVYGL